MSRVGITILLILNAGLAAQANAAQPVVPGTGTLIDFVGDDFEDTNWSFIHNHPKSSREQDKQLRYPTGKSTNGRWYEGPERGHPDSMEVVSNPPGALPGSKYGLLVRTLHSGIPGRSSNDVQQDDLIVDCTTRIGQIPVSEGPNVVTRVYLPPADEWEKRSGPHFGFRGTANTTVWKLPENHRNRFVPPQKYRAQEQYWPGIWVHFESKSDPRFDEDAAFLTVRGNSRGHDFKVRHIPQEEFGWWTFGISFTPDGMVHYYAKPGVDDLTEEDHLTSQFPYSFKAERFETMFFNFCNWNDGKTWSTPFIIDDPQLFVVYPERVQAIVRRKQQTSTQQAEKMRQQEDRQRLGLHAHEVPPDVVHETPAARSTDARRSTRGLMDPSHTSRNR